MWDLFLKILLHSKMDGLSLISSYYLMLFFIVSIGYLDPNPIVPTLSPNGYPSQHVWPYFLH